MKENKKKSNEQTAEAAQKEQWKSYREALKSAKAALEVKWKETKVEHEKAVDAWKLECQRLTVEGVQKRDLPRKPARPKKPQTPLAGLETSAERSDEELDMLSSDNK